MYLLILTEGVVAALIGWLIIILVLLVLPLPVLRRQRTEGALCYAVLFVFLLFNMASPHMFARFWVVTLMLPLGLILPPVAKLNASRSEEHPSELQSLMRRSYAVFCLKNKKTN